MIKRNLILLISLNITLLFSKGSIISGNIYDLNSNDPLIGANIIVEESISPNDKPRDRIKKRVNNLNLGSATDIDGYYKIQNVPIGDYTITVLYIGYETQKKNVKIKADENYTFDFKLSPSAIQLQETIVTGTKRKEKITSRVRKIRPPTRYHHAKVHRLFVFPNLRHS